MALLRVPEPYDFALSTERFRRYGPDPANLWHEGGLHRVAGGREVRIEASAGGVDVAPLDGETRPVVERLLGLPHDLDGFRRFATGHAGLGPHAARFPGLRPTLVPDPWEALVTSITAQQVSLAAAFAIRRRLVERFGERAEVAWAFPPRERLAAVREEELVALGFSGRKAEYVVGLARSDVDLGALAALPDEEVKARIVAVRGLGEWSADWFLARCLGRPRAWPAGDLAVRKAAALLDGGAPILSIEETRRVGERLDPWQNLSAHLLLAALAAGTVAP